MPGRGGSEVIAELRAVDPSMTLVVLTGYGSIAIAISAVKKGAARVEWEHLQCGISDCGGNISQASKAAGDSSAVSALMPRFVRRPSHCTSLFVRSRQACECSSLGRGGGGCWCPCCKWGVRVVFVVKL